MATCRIRQPRVPERVEQEHIKQLLRSAGGTVYVIGTTRRRGDYQGTMQTPGVPDLMAFLPPRGPNVTTRFLFVECKARGGRLRPEQFEFQQLCGRASVSHVVGNLDAVIAWLVEHEYVRAESFPHYRQPQDVTHA